MARHYFDSSALVKLYHNEPGTSVVEQIALQAGSEIVISRLTLVELQSAIALKLRTGAIKLAEVGVLQERIEGDLADGGLRVVAVTGDHFGQAEQFVKQFGATHGLRTLDSIQLAVAADLWRNRLIDSFVVADKVLATVAALQSLSVIEPRP